MKVNVFDVENFEKEVLNYEGTALVDFYADWCGPCKIMSPIISEIAEELENVKVGKVNVDENGSLAEKYGIMSIPTIIVFKDGKPINSFVGVIDKEKIKSSL